MDEDTLRTAPPSLLPPLPYPDGCLQTRSATMHSATWNVRGLTNVKTAELILHMQKINIDVLCLQEIDCKRKRLYGRWLPDPIFWS
eukprot:6465898-Pyramimonas_sp.AAC.1